ncbi:CheR family methyltransferase [Vreelandella populi]|uniref:Chemotaxis protein methyltransferase n=1 Tax=Vreelandella populi TaxID=2498858 RepID=A0A3S0YAU1_9GAMM|nr:CheR family methyltransferase [Halomonas populi]RUR41373.1 chemotaxis protein CheR [Halomonas populi]RUR44223.1 chemotaxis protein CheR [Halomonas populi]RUR56215.1 chemotaxis protein CheR [Halomonas populi]
MTEQRERGVDASQWSSGNQIERDLVLTDADFARIRELIYQRAGIVLAEHKREMVYSRLAKRLRHHNMTRFTDYLVRLERQPEAKEWEAFTNALTTNLTAFFREAHHFPLLAEHIRQKPGPVTIWCSAASTGEEPYSLAMTLLETLGPKAAQARIIATDIDTDALSRARAGIYPQEQVRKLDEARVKRFFQKGTGQHQGLARVRPEVSELVEFMSLNLLAPQWSVKGPFDAIFCRNIMIYFDKETQAKILKRFAPLMKPDGLLFAGHSENFSYISDAFKLRGQTVYTRA